MLGLIIAGISSCQLKEASLETVLVSRGKDASGPYLTKDNQDNPVLCWAEKSGKDSVYQLKYAVFNKAGQKFGAPVTVRGSAGMSNSPESMGKIAFKSDNTVIAVFAKSFPEEKSPFAGGIYYTSSTDKGKNWAEPQFLHSDTSRSYGRSFFDITRTKSGEVAAIWLDGRFGKSIKGSALFYSVTGKDQRFVQDKCIHKGTCECCRTDILQDDDGNIHLAYRSILFPTDLLGKQARDMVYSFSTDNGASFSDPQVISKDNWAIEGCPHTGPSLAIQNRRVNAVWFTAGGSSGIYHTAARAPGSGFQNRSLLTASGKHPQMTAAKNGELLVASEESSDTRAEHPKAKDHSMKAMPMNHSAPGSAKIILRVLDTNGSPKRAVDITDGQFADHHAVLTAMGKDLLVAWVRENKEGSGVYYTIVRH